MVKKNSRRATVGDRVDNLIETVNSNHLETIERLTKLETKLADVPERVTALEAARNQTTGGLSTLDKIFNAACALIASIAAYLSFKH